MAALSSAGIGSGLDVNGIVSQLMALEQRPITQVAAKEATYQAQVSAYGSVKGAVSTFQNSVSALANASKFSAVIGNVADSTVASVTVSPGAPAANYSLDVQSLAQAQKVKSTAFASNTTTLGSGKLTISFGTYSGDTFTLNPDKASADITIGAGQNTLSGIRDAINNANVGVTAGIVNDGTGYRLTISSKDSGTANAIRVAVADDDGNNTNTSGLSQLAFDARTVSGVQNLTESVAAKDAKVVLDGITITKPSNTISDALEGVTLNLMKTSGGTPTSLTIAQDTTGINNAVNSFVKSYNDLNKTLTDLTKYDAENKKASTLTGEATIRSMQTELRAVFNKALSTAGGGVTSLSDIGITFQTDGTLKLDQTKLTAALKDPTKDISTLFAAVGKPTDPTVAVTASTADTKNGKYDVNITTIATQGKAVGSAPAALAITAGSNDTLDVLIDGVSATVTLSAGNYTADSLAAEIQAKVNGASALSTAGVKVAVTQSGGTLTMTSARYGSVSKVSIPSGKALADVFGAPVETQGVDVAGTIGGIAATGTGQTLTGLGDAKGLALKITAGATGARGTVNFARGYAYELNQVANNMLGDHSEIDNRVNGLKTTIKDLEKQQTDMTARLSTTETRLRAQYSALDTMMAKMQQTSSYLTQQLAALPKMS